MENKPANDVISPEYGSGNHQHTADVGIISKTTPVVEVSSEAPRVLETSETVIRAADRHSREDYLEREYPALLTIGSTSSSPGTIIAYHNVETIFNPENTQYFYLQTALSGFYSIKCKFSCTVKVTVVPGTQGIMGLSWAPWFTFQGYMENIGDQYTPIRQGAGSARLPMLTTLPHVLINVATETEKTLTMDYTGQQSFLQLERLRDQLESPGTFLLWTYAPTRSAVAPATLDVQLYTHLSEVTLFGAKDVRYVKQGITDLVPMIGEIGKAAGSAVMNALPEEGEAVIKAVGSTARKVVNVGKILKDIPFLEDVIPIGTVTDVADTILSFFGFSKPTMRHNYEPVVPRPFGSPQHVDTIATCQKMTLYHDQAIETMSMGPTALDEMNISYLTKYPAYLWNFGITNTQKAWVRLTDLPVGPNCSETANVGTSGVICPNPLYYVSDHAEFWRGSIDYIFRVSCTMYHSCTLRIILTLNTDPAHEITDPWNPNQHYIEHEVKGPQDFVVRVPYIFTEPWQRVPTHWDPKNAEFFASNPLGAGNVKLTPHANRISVWLQKPLIMTGGVASGTVDVMIESRAGPDYALAVPRVSGLNPIMSQLAPPTTFDDTEDVNFNQQTEAKVNKYKRKLERLLFSKKTNTVSTEPAATLSPTSSTGSLYPMLNSTVITEGFAKQMDETIITMCPEHASDEPDSKAYKVTIGEPLVSTRALLKRYQRVGQMTSTGTKEGSYPTIKFVMLPFMLQNMGSNNKVGSFMGRFGAMYRYYRGGIRYLIRFNRPVVGTMTVVSNPTDISTMVNSFSYERNFLPEVPLFAVNFPSRKNTLSWAGALDFPVDTVKQELEFEIPYQSRYPLMLNTPEFNGENVLLSTAMQSYIAGIDHGTRPNPVILFDLRAKEFIPEPDNVNFEITVYRAAADDFSFGYFIGAPICTLDIINQSQ